MTTDTTSFASVGGYYGTVTSNGNKVVIEVLKSDGLTFWYNDTLQTIVKKYVNTTLGWSTSNNGETYISNILSFNGDNLQLTYIKESKSFSFNFNAISNPTEITGFTGSSQTSKINPFDLTLQPDRSQGPGGHAFATFIIICGIIGIAICIFFIWKNVT